MESDSGHEQLFQWHEEFSVAVDEMDDHHKKLFNMSEKVIRAVDLADEKVAERALDFLIEYSQSHFLDEEDLMLRHGYPELHQHKRIHKRLTESIIKLQKELEANSYKAGIDLGLFLKEWILNHVLTEDQKYAHFLGHSNSAK
ncbi:MAG: hemerythrin family protein [Magnetococcales bacterium]|nr:hemerythrin family protein [Magnetococcales bacterium]